MEELGNRVETEELKQDSEDRGDSVVEDEEINDEGKGRDRAEKRRPKS